MNKRLLEEISRQKELMMVNEQLAQTVFGGLKDAMGQAIFKSFMDAALDSDDFIPYVLLLYVELPVVLASE